MNDKKEKVNLDREIGTLALGNYLSEWDTDKSYDEIQELMQGMSDWDGSEDVLVWEKFESDTPSDVADHISTLHDDIKSLFEDILTEVVEEQVGQANEVANKFLSILKGL